MKKIKQKDDSNPHAGTPGRKYSKIPGTAGGIRPFYNLTREPE